MKNGNEKLWNEIINFCNSTSVHIFIRRKFRECVVFFKWFVLLFIYLNNNFLILFLFELRDPDPFVFALFLIYR